MGKPTTPHLLLQAKNPKGVGSVEHYFHFLFDLVLPLFQALHNDLVPRDATLYIRRRGLFVDLLKDIFEREIHILENADHDVPLQPLQLAGADTSVVRLSDWDVEAFRQYMLQRFKIPRRPKKHVLLIERSPPTAYFTSQDCEFPGSGAARRTIQNHDQLRQRLEHQFGSDLLNLRLEEIPFAEQIDRFHNARVVIGQHGAGLANCIWMEPGSLVFELTHTGFTHYFNLSTACRLRHRFFPMFGPKSKINARMLVRFVLHELLGPDER